MWSERESEHRAAHTPLLLTGMLRSPRAMTHTTSTHESARTHTWYQMPNFSAGNSISKDYEEAKSPHLSPKAPQSLFSQIRLHCIIRFIFLATDECLIDSIVMSHTLSVFAKAWSNATVGDTCSPESVMRFQGRCALAYRAAAVPEPCVEGVAVECG